MKNKLKLIASEVIHKLNIVQFDKTQHTEILNAIKTDGYHVIPDFIDSDVCHELRIKADQFIENNQAKVKYESNDCDIRVYGVDKHTKEFSLDKVLDLSHELFQKFSWTSKPEHFMLLGKIISGERNQGSGSGWHRDSPLRHQFKTILYLSDVTTENGPFQFIKGSQKYAEVKKVASHLNLNLHKRRFEDEEIQTLIDNNIVPEPKTFTATAGTLIIVDTRGLHRGKPLKSGNRYALTNYHFENGINKNFGVKNDDK